MGPLQAVAPGPPQAVALRGYVVISVIGLIARRQWLTRVGPFEASQAVETLGQEAEGLRAELDDARQTIDLLEERLSESDQALKEAQTDVATLLDLVDTIDGTKGDG